MRRFLIITSWFLLNLSFVSSSFSLAHHAGKFTPSLMGRTIFSITIDFDQPDSIITGQTPAAAPDGVKEYLPLQIKKSAEAAAFSRFVDIPVGHYTGTPNISIPLYTVQTRSLSLPISLNYQASGIKVEDEATQVGLGWTLDVGGMISRSIRGRDDFQGILRQGNPDQDNMNAVLMPNFEPSLSSYGRKFDRTDALGSQAISLFLFCLPNQNSSNNFWNLARMLANPLNDATQIGNSAVDSQYDIFNFKAGGYSGKFIITRHEAPYKIYVLSQEPIRIELLSQGVSGIGAPDMTGASGFRIITPDGVQYYYTMTERSSSVGGSSKCGKIVRPEDNPYSATPNGIYQLNWDSNQAGGADNSNLRQFISAWYLTKVVSASNDNESIRLSYNSTLGLATIPLPNRSQNISVRNNGSSTWRITDTRQQIVMLSSIVSAHDSVTFERSDRIDMRAKAPEKHQKLDQIKVFNLYQEQVMGYKFEYGYFDSGDTTQPDFVRKRLRLDRLAEFGQDSQLKPPYLFSYHSATGGLHNLPNKNSYAQDFWGYYNGELDNDKKVNPATGSNNLLPEMNGTMVPVQLPNPLLTSAWGFSQAAKREPKLEFARSGTLNSIQYPTGGNLQLDYEFHEFNNYLPVTAPNSYIVTDFGANSVVRGAGLRVSETRLFPGTSPNYLSTKYLYLGNTQMPSGKLMYDASFSYFLSYNDGVGQVFSSTPRESFSQSANGHPVGYSKVREIRFNSATGMADNGYTDYEFENKVDRRYDQFCFDIQNWGYTTCNIPSPFPDAIPCGYVTPVMNGSAIFYNQIVLQDSSIPNTISIKNGLLLSKKMYTSDHQLQQEEINTYGNPLRIQIPSYTATGRSGTYENYPALFKYYVNAEWVKLESKTINTYPANNAEVITNVINYEYSPIHRQVVLTVSTNSTNDVVSTRTKYPHDYASGSNVYGLMVERNIITPVITKIDSNRTKQVEVARVQNDYSNFGDAVTPQILMSATTKTIGGASSNGPDATFKYNSSGNLVEIMPRSGVATSFLWAYYDQYPVVQVDGVTYTQLLGAITSAGLNLTSFQTINGSTQDQRDADLSSKLGLLRNMIGGSGLMHSYTYKLLIGKTTHTMPNSQKLTYSYDGFNRLTVVKNHRGETVKSYRYNY